MAVCSKPVCLRRSRATPCPWTAVKHWLWSLARRDREQGLAGQAVGGPAGAATGRPADSAADAEPLGDGPSEELGR
eukprot:5149314-Alexandrium_andersonii.AAC.1